MNAFESLRHVDRPVDPSRAFTEHLRAELTAVLSPTIDLPERNISMNDPTDPSNVAANDPPADAATSSATLVPYLAIAGAAQAIEWYSEVLGARETVRYTGDDGLIGHAQLSIGGAAIMLSDEYPDYDAVAPTTLGGTAVTMNLNVNDVDEVWRRAIARGADGRRPPADQPYGDRSCTFVDPFGHRWMVQTTISNPTIAEIGDAMDGFTVTEPERD
jgi:PhnB protein